MLSDPIQCLQKIVQATCSFAIQHPHGDEEDSLRDTQCFATQYPSYVCAVS